MLRVTRRRQVLRKPAVQVVAAGDLALLAARFPEPEDPLGALVLDISSPETGDSADADPGVGEGSQASSAAEAHNVGSVDRAKQVPGSGDRVAGTVFLRRWSLHTLRPLPAKCHSSLLQNSSDPACRSRYYRPTGLCCQ